MKKNNWWVNKIKEYEEKFEKYGDSVKSLKWTSQKVMTIRFNILLRDLDINGKSVLDVGCGFGTIIPFLEKKSKNFSYMGVDMVDDFINLGRQKYPNYDFMLLNYFQKPLNKDFDIIICSGVLNSNFEENKKFREYAIKTMFDHAKEILAFGMTGSHPQPKNRRSSQIYYSDSLQIIKYCMSLTKKIVFRQDYSKTDFTLFLYR